MPPPDPEQLLVDTAERLRVEDPCGLPVDRDTPADAVQGVARGIVGALVDVEAGRLAEARTFASRAVGLARRTGVPEHWVGRAVATSAWTLSATDHRSAEALARRATVETDDPWTRTLGAIVRARAAMARGEARAALEHLGDLPLLPRYRASASALEIRALLAARRADRAREVLESALAGPEGQWPWVRGELLAASAAVHLANEDGDLGHARVTEVLAAIAPSRAPLVAALHQAAGDFERWAGRLDDAAASYREAFRRLAALEHPAASAVRGHVCLIHLLSGRLDEARAELLAFEADAPPGVAAVLGAAIAAAAQDRSQWARHHEHARAWLVGTGAADHALCFRLAREAWSAGLDRDDRSRAFRAGSAALAEWRALGREKERRDEYLKLRALARLGVPIPAGPFDLMEVLGAGGAGQVWRGRHHVHGIEVAVKVLRRDVTGDDTLRDGFHTEIRVVAGLAHPGIVRVLGHGELDETAAMAGEPHHQGAPWYAMELVQGGTAQEVCGRLRWSACRGILLGVLDALAHAHARGVLHLDIKPANVLLEALPAQPGAFRPRLADFGLSGLAIDGGPASGTPQYMAPEQFRVRDLGPWTDLYAVGCLATALVTGHPPFRRNDVEGLRQAHLAAEPPELLPVVEVPRGFEEWIQKLLQKAPADRFEAAADASWALFRLADPLTDDPPRNASLAHQNTAPITFSLPSWAEMDDDDEDGEDDGPLLVELPPMPTSWRPPATEPLPGIQALELFELKRVPLVGRARERDLLWATLADVHRRRRPRFVSLEGRGGSGRSQLAAWFMETARERGAAVTHVVRCGRGGVGFSDLIRALEAHERVRTGIDGLSATDRATLDRWRGTDDDDGRAEEPDSDQGDGEQPWRSERQESERVGRAVGALLALAAAKRPLVLSLEDTPAADLRAIELCRTVLGSEAAIVLVFEASPGEDQKADRRYEELLDLPPTTALTLEPLRMAEVRELVKSLLPIEPALADRIVERAATDVDLAVAFVRDLVRRDALREDSGTLFLRDGQDLGIGATLLRKWIDRLEAVLEEAPRALRDVLATLAVPEREFGTEDWKSVADAWALPAPSHHLRTLRSRRMLLPTPSRGLVFSHPSLPDHLLEEAAADGRLGGVSRAALERLTFDHPGRRGLALLDASEPTRALDPLAEGLSLSRDRGDPEMTRRLTAGYEAALRMVGIPEGDARWLPVLLGRAHLATREEDRERAVALASAAVALATGSGRPVEEYESLQLLAGLSFEQGDGARATELLKRALQVARTLEDPRRVARIRAAVADAAMGRGDLDGALRQYRRGLDDLADLPWDDIRAELSLGLGRVLAARGDVEQAESTLTEALTRLSASGDDARVAEAMSALGRIALLRGRNREASRWFAEALARLPDKDRNARADLLLDQCTVLLAEERWDALRSHVDQILAENPSLPQDTKAWALALLLAAQAPEPGGTFEGVLETLESLLRTTVMASVEIARVLEAAAQRASVPGRKRRCWTLAEAQWRTVGEREAARRAREQARRLGG